MTLPFQSNMNIHLGKLANILRMPTNRKLEQKIHRNQRSLRSSISCLYQQSLSLLKREKQLRMMRMKIDKIRRHAKRMMENNCSAVRVGIPNNGARVDVVDSDTSEVIITQDDLDGEEQLARLEQMASFDSGLGSFEKPSINYLKTDIDLAMRNDEHNSGPIDLSSSSFKKSLRLCTPPQCYNDTNNIVTSTPISNNLPTRRSADDHLEQFMMVDPNQNIKWKQLADKFNKELGPNVCGVCHKTLSCKSALTMHYRVHTEERPFVCKVCEKRFSTKGNLKTHLGQHADVTDHYCMGPSMTANQLRPANVTMPSPIAINSQHQRLPIHHNGAFPFPFPANPHLLLNMLGHQNVDFNIIEALKASQKTPISDMNANFMDTSDENTVSHSCTCCRQRFPSKLILDNHLRTHSCGGKDYFGTIGGGKYPNCWTDAEENDQKSHLKNNTQNFSLTTIMGLSHNNPASWFPFLNRAMMPPFPGFVPHLATPNQPVMPRLPMAATPANNFNYNNTDLDSHQ